MACHWNYRIPARWLYLVHKLPVADAGRICHPSKMTSDDPFGRRPHSVVEEFYRREKQRSDLIKQALGPTYALQQQMNALKPHLGLMSEMQNAGLLGAVDQARKLHAEEFRSLNLLMSSQRLSGVTQAAMALSQHNDGLLSNIRNLSRSFDTGILATAKALQDNNSVLAAAMAASKWQDQWKSLAEQLSPGLLALRATAERAMILDMATLRATAEHLHGSVAYIAAQQVIEAQELAEALTHAETPDESAKLFVAFVAAIAAIFKALGDNTLDELRRQGLLGLLVITMTIMALPQLQPDPGMTAEEQQAYSELQEKVDDLQDSLRELIEAEGELSGEYVASLPRGELARKANIRSGPSGSAARIMVADAGTPIAVVKSEKRWRLVVYRDPLTEQLAQGWVYEMLVAMVGDDQS